MDILTATVNQYIAGFSGYVNQFVEWGQWIFYSLLTINIVWLTLWYAFDKNSFVESMADFLRQFFLIALFYTIMMNHEWLVSILQTANVMGKTLAGFPIDPSSIISNGIAIANKIIIPIHQASIITAGFGLLVGFAAWVVITFTFISIALNLAVTLIIATALITVSTFFLGFAAFSGTSQIARQALDVVLSNCVKLLGIYLTVGVGAKTITGIVNAIPAQLLSFDAYTWIIAACLLFWLVSKTLPEQLARIVSGSFQAHHGTSAAALTVSAVQYARTALSPMRAISPKTGIFSGMSSGGGAGGIVRAQASFDSMSKSASSGSSGSFSGAAGGEGKSLPNVGEQFKSILSKMNGSSGSANPSALQSGNSASSSAQSKPSTTNSSATSAFSGASSAAANTVSGINNNAGAPSSAGRKAAGASSTRSVPRANKK